MRELFIYYRSQTTHAGALHSEVLAMQAELQARHPGLRARLYRRPEAADGRFTWMETYAAPQEPDGLSDALAREIELAAQRRLGLLIDGPRHIESFIACAS